MRKDGRATADATENGVGRNIHIFEDKLPNRRGPQAQLFHRPAGPESMRRALDDERRNAAIVPFFAVRQREDDDHVSDRPVRDERLRPVDAEAVAVGLCLGAQGESIRPRLGFAHSIDTDEGPVRESRQIPVLLLLTPERADRNNAREEVGTEGKNKPAVLATTLNLSQFVEDQNGLHTSQILLS
jgi:hypothetical protein